MNKNILTIIKIEDGINFHIQKNLDFLHSSSEQKMIYIKIKLGLDIIWG